MTVLIKIQHLFQDSSLSLTPTVATTIDIKPVVLEAHLMMIRGHRYYCSDIVSCILALFGKYSIHCDIMLMIIDDVYEHIFML